MIAIGTEVPELTEEHRDGTSWVDVDGNIWTPHVWGGWWVTYRLPFLIGSRLSLPVREYGPYRAVLGPANRTTT